MKQLNIGRAENNNLVLKHQKISSNHCTIRQVADNEFVIEDHDSSNGTFVNGKRIKQCLLKTNDTLTIADIEVKTEPILALFAEDKLPVAFTYEQLLKKQEEIFTQKKIFDDFQKLKSVYENYQKDKKKIMKNDTTAKSGIRAVLSLIPFIGMALCQLLPTVGKSMQEKLLDRNEQFKIDYICPGCFKFLGEEPWENKLKQASCSYCKCKWVS